MEGQTVKSTVKQPHEHLQQENKTLETLIFATVSTTQLFLCSPGSPHFHPHLARQSVPPATPPPGRRRPDVRPGPRRAAPRRPPHTASARRGPAAAGPAPGPGGRSPWGAARDPSVEHSTGHQNCLSSENPGK